MSLDPKDVEDLAKAMNKTATGGQAGNYLQGGSLAVLLSLGAMIWSNFDELRDSIQTNTTGQGEVSRSVAQLTGTVEGLSQSIGDVTELRSQVARLEAEMAELRRRVETEHPPPTQPRRRR